MMSNQPLPFKLWTLEIKDQSDSELRDPQVIEDLSPFQIGDPVNGLGIYNDPIEHDQVGKYSPTRRLL